MTAAVVDTGIEFTDVFCGAGGSSAGLAAAGLRLKLAANHWPRAIESHAANFPDAEHLIADINNYDMRRLPRTHVLWASPICTEVSPSGGRKRKARQSPGQLEIEELGHVAKPGFERTRATFWDVIRATEVHRYPIVIVENVVEAVTQWELFDIWLAGMRKLGYHAQIVSVSAAHVYDDAGNDPAPQWRDRIYIFCTRLDITAPVISPSPKAWCFACVQLVDAVQSWKRPEGLRVGKYGQQYVYRCPRAECRHAIVEPYVLPALAAIDLTDIGQRIGDRKKPLAPATMRRMHVGRRLFGQPVQLAVHGHTYERPGYARVWPADQSPMPGRSGTPGDGFAYPSFLDIARTNNRPHAIEEPLAPITTGRNHNLVTPPPGMICVNHDDGAYVADERPLATRSTKLGDGMIWPPMVVPAGGTWNTTPTSALEPIRTRTTRDTEGVATPPAFLTLLRNNQTVASLDDPLSTVTSGGRHHGLTVPAGFIQKHHGGLGYAGAEHMVKDLGQPLATIVARANLSLVIPYRRGSVATRIGTDPLSTVATIEQHGTATAPDDDADLQDWHFRMLKPREHGRAQRFRDSYIITGNQGEQTMQFGNAVASNVPQWLAGYVIQALGGAA